MSKKKRTIIIVCLIIVLYAASKFRIARSGDSQILIVTLSSDVSWTTYPVTIHTDCGDIQLKSFTPINYSNGYVRSIYNDRGDIKHNLVFMGNSLNQDIWSIHINKYAEIDGLGFPDTPQEFVIDGFSFSINLFRTDYVDNYVWYVVLDFEKIILQDNTVIILGPSVVSYCIFRQKNSQWELYKNHFIVTNPEWEEEKHLDNIVFEPNWGKLISYDETTEDEWD